jgi:ATP-binding cassette subfamily F protein 3
MSAGNVILRFDNVTFGYSDLKHQLEEACFSVREDSKITIMGQNGAGKSTIFKLITGELKANKGNVFITGNASIGIAPQVMDPKYFDLTIVEYFETAFSEKIYNIDKRAKDVMEVVNLSVPLTRKISELSGGQKARILLAYALIQNPDILLLDEPTNNLDSDGIDHLTTFLIMYPKTVIVISHDSYFLNSFTDGVLHLDVYTQKVQQFVGNYLDVVEQITAEVERDQRKNAQLLKNIQDRKDKVNFFAHKGGKMRKLASKLREEIEESEDNMVDVKREDKTIRDFEIEAQQFAEEIVKIQNITILKNHVVTPVDLDITLRRRNKLIIKGPNGIGKSTLLEKLSHRDGMFIHPDVKIGYYRQDFSGLDYEQTGLQALASVMGVPDNEEIYATAAQFLLTSNHLKNKVGSFSEGQKGLLCYAQFVLQKPGLLILDEPTNHINFRHLPVIAKALDAYQGAMILVSHAYEFVEQIKISEELDLSRF